MGEGRRARARAWRWGRAILVLAAAGAVARPLCAHAEEECRSWPGEPTPLPTVDDADPVRARWAELRAAELAALAQAAEATERVESHRLWLRVLCMDRDLDVAWQGLARTRPVQVHRPEVRWGPPGPPSVADAWAGLDAPLRIARPERAPPSRPQPRQRDLAQVEQLLAQGDASLRAARFAQALEHAAAAQRRLEGSGAEASALRVRADVLAATAQVALGETEAARQSFAHALDADPDLRLDPMSTSPKVMRELEAARAGRGR